MSFFSGIVDGIFGEGSSDSAISSINDYTGINLDFGLSSSSTTPTPKPGDDDSSFFSPSNIIGGLGVYSQIAGKQDALKATQQTLDAKAAESALDFERQKELIALKAALSGGGGGGGGGSSQAAALAHDAAKTKYLGVQDAMKNRSEAQLGANSNIIQAIRNLTEAAQRPLSR